MSKYAYVIIHFGNNPKYFEYELYTIIMLKSISNMDVVYLCSKNDTPKAFTKVIKKFGVRVIRYDDSIITNEIKNFQSVYEHFNSLKTCASMFAYLLTDYEKVCIVESDIILIKGIDTIFDLQSPAMLWLNHDNSKDKNKNNEIFINTDFLLQKCNKESYSNGGVMLLKPDKKIFKIFKNNFSDIVKNKCVYPNETLFWYVSLLAKKKVYNLPNKYNFSKYSKYSLENVYCYHFHHTTYKHLDIVRDNYIETYRNKKQFYDALIFFKKEYYDPNHEKIEKILKKVKSKISLS